MIRNSQRDAKSETWRIITGSTLIMVFIIWTMLIRTVDVQPVGVNGTDVGFAAFSTWFHALTGVHMWIYTITDWLGLVPIFVCASYGVLGLVQWIKRKNIAKVDADILILGVYYILVILAYLLFEMFPINYRPVLINGYKEPSYPSSTVLLVLSVMPTLIFQIKRRSNNETIRKAITITAVLFSLFMSIGRLIAGVHWCTDIVGAALLSSGLYLVYKGIVISIDDKKQNADA